MCQITGVRGGSKYDKIGQSVYSYHKAIENHIIYYIHPICKSSAIMARAEAYFCSIGNVNHDDDGYDKALALYISEPGIEC